MATIEESAYKASAEYRKDIVRFRIPTFEQAFEDGYIKGAHKQNAINDLKVSEIYEWIDKHAIVIEGLNGAFVNAYELKDIINNITGEE